MDYSLQDGKIVFTIDGQTYSREEVHKLFNILKDLMETNSYELPYRGEDLISRTTAIMGKSKK